MKSKGLIKDTRAPFSPNMTTPPPPCPPSPHFEGAPLSTIARLPFPSGQANDREPSERGPSEPREAAPRHFMGSARCCVTWACVWLSERACFIEGMFFTETPTLNRASSILRQAQTSLCFALRPVEPETSVLHVHWGERAFDQLFVSECWGLNLWFAFFPLSKPLPQAFLQLFFL